MDNEKTDVIIEEEALESAKNFEQKTESTSLTPLTAAALQHFDEEKKKEIIAVSEKIDVRDIEKIMAYGSIPLMRSFDEAGKVLKNLEGSQADQTIIKEVIELSKKANENYDEFNLTIQEPSFFQKLLLKISTAAKQKQDKEVKVRAITCFKLLEELKNSCDNWLELLKNTYSQIYASASNDKMYCEELEEYIVAGKLAEERIQNEILQAEENYRLSGLTSDKEALDTLKSGYETFQLVLLNLEKSRGGFALSIGQLAIDEKANRNIQISVQTQKANSMALMSQQLRNATLDATNKEAMEAQKNITRLNDQLLDKVSRNSVLTAEESEEILKNGVYSIESALTAAKTVVEGYNAIEKAHSEISQDISAQMDSLKEFLDSMSPFVSRLNDTQAKDSDKSKTLPKESGLVF